MKALENVLRCGPSGYVYASSLGGHIAQGKRNSLTPENVDPVRFDDSFDIASITKIMSTTALVMELVKNNELSLTTKVSQLLGGWGGDKSEITIEHLLRHRSGLAPWRPLYIRQKSTEEVHAFIAREPLARRIDSERVYSDLGFITLGRIVEVVTGKRISQAFDEIIKNPFGLTQTQYATAATMPVSTSRGDRAEKQMVETNEPFQIPEMADEFSYWRTHVLTGEINDGNAFHVFGGIAGHAGLFTTAQDLLTFAEEIAQHELFEKFTASGPDENAHLGFMSWNDTVGTCTDRFYGHTGFTGVAFGISQQHHEVALLLANRLNTDITLTPTSHYWAPVLHELHSHIHSH